MAIEGLTDLFAEAKSNPLLGAAMNIKPAYPRQKSPTTTSEETNRAKSVIARFESLPIDEIRTALNEMSVRDLQGVANAIGIRPQRIGRETLAQQVATKITNTRGYRSLRDGTSRP
jgi:hypothetical protein